MPFFDDQGKKTFDRNMRAYLVKDEGIFEKLAVEKQQEDFTKKSSDGSKQGVGRGGTPSSYGSYKNNQKDGALGSYNNSSDDSTAARGGSGS